MALTYKQVVYIFTRSFEWMNLSDKERIEKINDEMQRINWELVPDNIGCIIYEDYYRK